MITVEVASDVAAGLGEGPCWDAGTATMLWVDIPAGAIHRTTPDTGATTTLRHEPPVSMVLPTARGLVVALRTSIALLGRDGTETVLGSIRVDDEIRCNDGKCDPAGRLWIGTMHTARRPRTARLYRLDPGGVLTKVLDGVTVSNGIGWSPDGHTLYYVDTPTLGIDRFDHDPATGAITGRRRFADLADSGGRPDGLTVDAAGCVWVALFAGGALRRYTPAGELDTVVPLPVSHPTSCAFGGTGLTDLYVTTASAPLSPADLAEQPLAGRLLRLRPPVAGLPAAELVLD